MTLAMFVIGILTLTGLALIGLGLCKSEEGYLITGTGLMVLTLLAVGARAEHISSERAYKQCIEHGHGYIKIFDKKACVFGKEGDHE